MQPLEKSTAYYVPILLTSQICKDLKSNLNSPSGELTAAVFPLKKFKNYLGSCYFRLIIYSTAFYTPKSKHKLSGKLFDARYV